VRVDEEKKKASSTAPNLDDPQSKGTQRLFFGVTQEQRRREKSEEELPVSHKKVKSHNEKPCNSARIAEGFLLVSSECD